MDTSPSKYRVIGNTLAINLTRVDGTDEGVYGCVYDPDNTTTRLCIYVYGKFVQIKLNLTRLLYCYCCLVSARAVFPSCPLDFGGCIRNPVLLYANTGESVDFNGTVTHTSGGSCGFKQTITSVKLRKINNTRSGVTAPLSICKSVDNYNCRYIGSFGRLSALKRLSRNDIGREFIFTLSNILTTDTSLFEVSVEVVHPNTAGTMLLRKLFHLEVGMRSQFYSYKMYTTH